MSNLRFILIGNPENRRVRDFSAALIQKNFPPPEVVSWLSLARGEHPLESLSAGTAIVRIDSFGESTEVYAEFLRRGGAEPRLVEHGELYEPARAHQGFLTVLADLEALFAARPAWHLLQTPAALRDLFDKRRTATLYRHHHLPTPEPLKKVPEHSASTRPHSINELQPSRGKKVPEHFSATPESSQKKVPEHFSATPESSQKKVPEHFLATPELDREMVPEHSANTRPHSVNELRPSDEILSVHELRDALDAHGWSSVFIKLSSSSSAAGLAIYQRRRGRESLLTTVRPQGDRFFNSRTVRRVERPDELEHILRFLLAQGSQVEQRLPKARLGQHYFDLRILVIAGEPAFTVVRQSRHEITNLHLGGKRADLADYHALVPAPRRQHIEELASRTATIHDVFHAGVDLLLRPHTHEPFILETNAFGDLLPNLERNGEDVYRYEITRILELHRSGALSNIPRPNISLNPNRDKLT